MELVEKNSVSCAYMKWDNKLVEDAQTVHVRQANAHLRKLLDENRNFANISRHPIKLLK